MFVVNLQRVELARLDAISRAMIRDVCIGEGARAAADADPGSDLQ